MSIDRLARKLSPTLKRALIIILEDGEIKRCKTRWEGISGREIYEQTVIALGERSFLSILFEKQITHGRFLRSAKLTDGGKYAALGIQWEGTLRIEERTPQHAISEKSARFIVEVLG